MPSCCNLSNIPKMKSWIWSRKSWIATKAYQFNFLNILFVLNICCSNFLAWSKLRSPRNFNILVKLKQHTYRVQIQVAVFSYAYDRLSYKYKIHINEIRCSSIQYKKDYNQLKIHLEDWNYMQIWIN